MKAMILAAGLGTRMRPLTNHTPKPLLKVQGKPLIVHHIEKLAQNNVREIIINVHYLRDQIMTTLGCGAQWNVRIQYSEEPLLLGAIGGIIAALPLLGNAPFILVSADIWTDYPFAQLLQSTSTLGHLVLVNNPPFHPTGDFCLTANGFVKERTEGEPSFTYANIARLDPALFAGLTAPHFDAARFFKPHLQAQQITGEKYTGPWENIGTVELLEKLNNVLLSPH